MLLNTKKETLVKFNPGLRTTGPWAFKSVIQLTESGIPHLIGIQIQVSLIRNPESSTWNQESTTWNSESKTVLDYLTRGEVMIAQRYLKSTINQSAYIAHPSLWASSLGRSGGSTGKGRRACNYVSRIRIPPPIPLWLQVNWAVRFRPISAKQIKPVRM